MAFGEYLSGKAEREYHQAEREREAWEVENHPEGEKREMVELYVEKGLSGEDSRTIVDILAKDKKVMVDVMMVEELGLLESDDSLYGNAMATFLSFVIFGFVPLFSYVTGRLGNFGSSFDGFPWACVLTALTLFSLGALKNAIHQTLLAWFGNGNAAGGRHRGRGGLRYRAVAGRLGRVGFPKVTSAASRLSRHKYGNRNLWA